MASIATDSSGRRRILFVAKDGRRKTIYLGKMSAKMVAAVKVRVEQLNSAQIAGHTVDDDTARWLSGIGDELAEKLASVGLCAPRESASLATFLDGYLRGRFDVKDSTATVYGHTRRCLVDYFGAGKQLREITAADAESWRLWLFDDQKLAENTIRRRCGMAKQFFRAAVRQKLISENPFGDLVATIKANVSRYYFVTREEAEKVLEACPTLHWRLLFALARFGGLRVPSEPLLLRWSDIDWEQGRMLVRSPKTEHHEGGNSRLVPIFPELRPYLQEALDSAAPGEEWVVAGCRDTAVNLRTHLQRIIRRAGLKPWPKLWQNLRSTRETELAEKYPLQAVVKWIGNTQQVAVKHYLQVTDSHFEHAASTPTGPMGGKETTRQRTQQGAEMACKSMTSVSGGFSEVMASQEVAARCEPMLKIGMGGTGFEPVTSTV